jgi:hypothetical protein
MNQSSLLRDVIGFVFGGLTAAVVSALVVAAFFGWPSAPSPRNYNGEDSAVLAVVVLVMFFCGGFIGRRGFSADFLSDLYPSVIGTYLVIVFLCIIAGLSFGELATMVGIASVSIVASTVVLLLLKYWFPPKTTDNYDA